MNVEFPYRIDGRGRTATPTQAAHLRNLIEQVLLTAPGERVMRPSFGSGLLGLVFEPGGPETVAGTQYLVQSALMQWLGHLLTVDEVAVTHVEGTFTVSVSYTVKATGQHRVDEFAEVAP